MHKRTSDEPMADAYGTSDDVVTPTQRFFVGSSAGVLTMVSDEVAEHHHMGD